MRWIHGVDVEESRAACQRVRKIRHRSRRRGDDRRRDGQQNGVPLLAYRAGILRATPMFTRVVVFATAGVALFYIVSLVLSMFGVVVSYFTSTSTLSIVINIAIAVLAAMNLVLSFAFIPIPPAPNPPNRLHCPPASRPLLP